jgi:DMSO reductase family type II enzyme heme b subunit
MTELGGAVTGRARVGLLALAGALSAVPPFPPSLLSAQDHPGKAVYDRWCAGCHGDAGAGDGEAAAYMLPRPRDFTLGIYQIRTTTSGSLPTDADLRRVIDEGMPGTAMPGWRARLSARERDDVLAYIKTFSRFFETDQPRVVPLGRAPRGGAEAIAEGRQVFETLECYRCHGDGGRGDGASAPTLTDDDGFPIRAADLTRNWTFTGGGSVEDIYARLRTGLDGTPMPSFDDVIDAGVITDEQLWRVAQYVRSLSPARSPRVREVIRARRVEHLPADAADPAWEEADAAFIPLVGQMVRRPRWFTPGVTGAWVRALHDGERLALRLAWSDPSRSPDPAWQEWLDRVGQTVARDDTTALPHGPDRAVVQFPLRVVDEMERPYFLGGSARRPVHLWRWSSDADRVEEGSSTEWGQFLPAAGPPRVSHDARFEAGEWQLQITRALSPADPEAAPVLSPGIAIPIAFYVADGSHGEDLVRGAISSWYALYLDVPASGRVFVQPVAAALLTAGLGILVVIRAQRRERRAAGAHAEE